MNVKLKVRLLLLAGAVVASCSPTSRERPAQSESRAREQPKPTASIIPGPQIPPVEFGIRPANTPMTHENMPYFDRAAYCLQATRDQDKVPKGPQYEFCVEYQQHLQIIIGEAIDSAQFTEDDIVRCAKASRTAYEGMWYCLNGQEF